MIGALKYIIFLLLLIVAGLLLPETAFDAKARDAILVVGIVGIWRWSWGALHLFRSIWFRKVYFPRLRRKSDEAIEKKGLGHAYMMVTSFRIDASTTQKAYRGAFLAAANSPAGGTVVCSIVELADERLIRRIAYVMYGDNLPFHLEIVRIPGTGKRDALAHGFRAIAAMNPDINDTVSVIDGDSIVPEDLVHKCAGMFLLDPNLGALTTDEVCTVEGSEIFKQWYSMRFAQRQILMSSHGLAKRVLTLTGRMSMFRAQLACNEEFIDHIQNDFIDHWRLGRIKMLTGDDKSSWFWLMARGYHTYYVPDIQVDTIEQPPDPNFLKSANVLMTRWFGNMLRTNSRAIALGPWKLSAFTWWSIIDQRISMWTSLTGFTLAILGAFLITPWTIAFYLLWVITSRYILALTFLTVRPSISLSYIPLLYFNQIFGSIIKLKVFFRLDRQKWTRQKTTLKKTNESRSETLIKLWSSRLMHVVAIVVFIAVLVVLADFHRGYDRQLPEKTLRIVESKTR